MTRKSVYAGALAAFVAGELTKDLSRVANKLTLRFSDGDDDCKCDNTALDKLGPR